MRADGSAVAHEHKRGHAAEQRRPAESRARHAAPLSPVRILLVEDYPDTLRVLARLLRHAGHEVDTASDLRSARALVESAGGSYDLLLSDIGLPDGSGRDLMRDLGRRYGLPGIAISGFGSDADIENSRLAGFSQHLVKPIDLDELEKEIQRVARRA